MFSVTFDMYQTLALAVAALILGQLIKKRVGFFVRFCIPAPVIGGMIFAIVSCILYVAGGVELSFDETLRTVCMVFFFTSVGFQANLKVLREGGKAMGILIVFVILLIFLQNIVALGLSDLLGVDRMIGMCTGSIPMMGGHGMSGAFGPVLEDFGTKGATTICTAAATFGLIAGSLIGGPVGNSLIRKKNLLKTAAAVPDAAPAEAGEKQERKATKYAPAAFHLIIAVGIGTIISWLLNKTGLAFPIYIGALIAAVIMRNISEYTGKITVPMEEVSDLGDIFLNLFLGIAMITLKLWQLAELALPLIILLAAQTLLIFLFARFLVYNGMGRDYDAAVISAGVCGFGMGATPNAMANMQAICSKYVPSLKGYLLIPIVGSLFNDLINSLVITFFINIL